MIIKSFVYIYSKHSLGHLLGILPTNFIFIKAFNLGFSHTEEWFLKKNNKPLEMEDIINFSY